MLFKKNNRKKVIQLLCECQRTKAQFNEFLIMPSDRIWHYLCNIQIRLSK